MSQCLFTEAARGVQTCSGAPLDFSQQAALTKLFPMDSCNDITSRILELFSDFTSAEHACELNDMIAQPIKTLSIYRVLEIRCAITSAADLELPAVAAALNLIDGQIALREIAAGAPWR